MENEIENERESMIMITVPHDNVWYQLQFSVTLDLVKLEKDVVMATFDSEVLNLRARLLKIYDAPSQI